MQQSSGQAGAGSEGPAWLKDYFSSQPESSATEAPAIEAPATPATTQPRAAVIADDQSLLNNAPRDNAERQARTYDDMARNADDPWATLEQAKIVQPSTQGIVGATTGSAPESGYNEPETQQPQGAAPAQQRGSALMPQGAAPAQQRGSALMPQGLMPQGLMPQGLMPQELMMGTTASADSPQAAPKQKSKYTQKLPSIWDDVRKGPANG